MSGIEEGGTPPDPNKEGAKPARPTLQRSNGTMADLQKSLEDVRGHLEKDVSDIDPKQSSPRNFWRGLLNKTKLTDLAKKSEAAPGGETPPPQDKETKTKSPDL